MIFPTNCPNHVYLFITFCILRHVLKCTNNCQTPVVEFRTSFRQGILLLCTILSKCTNLYFSKEKNNNEIKSLYVFLFFICQECWWIFWENMVRCQFLNVLIYGVTAFKIRFGKRHHHHYHECMVHICVIVFFDMSRFAVSPFSWFMLWSWLCYHTNVLYDVKCTHYSGNNMQIIGKLQTR